MSTQELVSRKVPTVRTKYRRIVTEIPAPGSLPALKKLHQYEPRSMGGQPPVVWDRAEGIQVYRPLGQHVARLVLRRAGHQRRPLPIRRFARRSSIRSTTG